MTALWVTILCALCGLGGFVLGMLVSEGAELD